MNTNLLLFTTYQISLALIFGLFTIYLVFLVLNKFVLKVDFLEVVRQNNLSVAIFEGMTVFCTLLLVETSILPAVDALRTMVFAQGYFHFDMLLTSLTYFFLFYTISLIFSFLVILIAFYAYIRSTKDVDEISELKQNNIAVAITLSVVILGLTLFVRPSFSQLLASIIDHDHLQTITPHIPSENQEVIPKQLTPPNR